MQLRDLYKKWQRIFEQSGMGLDEFIEAYKFDDEFAEEFRVLNVVYMGHGTDSDRTKLTGGKEDVQYYFKADSGR
jgi:hypothetical protein